LTIDLKSTSSSDPANGGPYRYNMLGYMGLKPAKWADFRFVVDGGASMTPDAFGLTGYGSSEIWIYDGSGYDPCTDTQGSTNNPNCEIDPYEGFWVELNSTTTGKSIQLIIPNGGA
jgi:hypothetical protein